MAERVHGREELSHEPRRRPAAGKHLFGNETIDAVRCVRTVQKLAKRYDWFTPSVRDIRMLRIEENNDLKVALEDDED